MSCTAVIRQLLFDPVFSSLPVECCSVYLQTAVCSLLCFSKSTERGTKRNSGPLATASPDWDGIGLDGTG